MTSSDAVRRTISFDDFFKKLISVSDIITNFPKKMLQSASSLSRQHYFPGQPLVIASCVPSSVSGTLRRSPYFIFSDPMQQVLLLSPFYIWGT